MLLPEMPSILDLSCIGSAEGSDTVGAFGDGVVGGFKSSYLEM